MAKELPEPDYTHGNIQILLSDSKRLGGKQLSKPLPKVTKGIDVNAVCLGAIDTDMTKGVKESGQVEQVLFRIPKGRLVQPEDIANLIVFLASDGSDYISGAAIVIDGGWLTT